MFYLLYLLLKRTVCIENITVMQVPEACVQVEERRYKFPWQIRLVLYVLSLVFQGFVIYALYASNSTAVSDACGRDLWNFMLARLIVALLFWVQVMLCTTALYSKGASVQGVCYIFLFLTMRSTLLGLGLKFTTDAMHNSACISALSDASFTHSALLGQLGYVFVSIDAFCVLFVFIAVCIACGIAISFNTSRK